jgi:glutaredoxin
MLNLVRFVLGKILNTLNYLTLPKGIQRTSEEQFKIDQQTQKLSLYQFEGCPFCIKVRRKIKRLNLNIDLRDAQFNPSFKKELIEQGGQFQTPCLRIVNEDATVQWLYESSDIVSYLDKRFLSPLC